MTVIEAGIPAPSVSVRVKQMGRLPIYPFQTMREGDSFTLPISEWKKLRSAANKYHKRNDIKLTVRKISDTLVRCWRV